LVYNNGVKVVTGIEFATKLPLNAQAYVYIHLAIAEMKNSRPVKGSEK